MKTKYLFLSALALCLAFSCQRQEENLSVQTLTFHAVNGENTKTVLQADGAIFWSPGDAINLFYGSSAGRFVSNNSEAAAYADFNGSPEGFALDGEKTFWAVYPYDQDNSFDGTAVSLTLPDEQTALSGTFARDLFVSMAQSQDYTLRFYNLCGGVKFSVTHEGITSVRFKGNNGEILAGSVKAAFDANGKPVVTEVVDGAAEVVLNAPKGSSFEPGEWYYIVTLPAILEQGYTLEFWRETQMGSRTSEHSVQIARSVWGQLEEADGDIVEDILPKAVDLGLSVAWASFELGTDTPTGTGSLFAWGETLSKDSFGWDNYIWGTQDALTKYNSLDGKTQLDPEDDAATAAYGGLWRIPSVAEWEELSEECTWTPTTRRGVEGYEAKSKVNGNTLFLPIGNGDGYWSAAIDENDLASGICVSPSQNGIEIGYMPRFVDERILAVYAPLFRFHPTRAGVGCDEASFTVEVVSSLGYKTSSVPSWVQEVSVEEAGLNRFIHTFTVSANPTTATRMGVIVFCNDNNQCVPFTVTQEAKPAPTVKADKSKLSFTCEAGEDSFNVTSNTDWTVAVDQPWCTVSPAEGSGDGVVTVSVSPNETEVVRSARITLASADGSALQSILVSQEETVIEADFDWTQTFLHRSLMMRFTATWCGYCPMMAHAVDYVQEHNPGLIEAVNLHASDSDLAFSGTRTLMNQYKASGYPSGVVDGRRSVDNYNDYTYTASVIAKYAHETEDNYPTASAIRYESEWDSGKLNLDLTLYLRYAGDYKVTVLLLESKIKANQTDYVEDVVHTDYIHNDIARMALSNISGDEFTTLKDCVAKQFNYNVRVPATYKKSNLRILVYVQRAYGTQKVIRSGNYGDYYVDNAISGVAGENLPVTAE